LHLLLPLLYGPTALNVFVYNFEINLYLGEISELLSPRK